MVKGYIFKFKWDIQRKGQIPGEVYYVTTLYKIRGGRIDRSNVRFMVCQNDPNLYLYRVADVNYMSQCKTW